MGGYTISNDPDVIRREERSKASLALEARVQRFFGLHYPYTSDPPTAAQIRATISALSVLCRSVEYRPIVQAALGLDEQ